MIVLNLKTNDNQQERLKAYLQENVNPVLADKINNGVYVEKDGKHLISKKDLDGFIDYACKQAQEQAEKGKHSAMVEDSVVFGWAMHYFEEDGIEGKLYNPDGTLYEPPKPKYTPKPTTVLNPPPIKKDIQPNMFDLLSVNKDADNQFGDDTTVNTEDSEDNDEITEEEKREVFGELEKEETETKREEPKTTSPIYTRYTELQKKYPDCVIAYRLGDFYEIFGENAVKIANVLDLTLTGRDIGLPERIPMVGFPYHAADVYIGKIIQKGFKVAIVENMNDITVKTDSTTINTETGEIIKDYNNDALINVLKGLFGNTMEIRL